MNSDMFYVKSPDKICVNKNCKKQYKIPEDKFVEGKGYPRFWTPFCPECQAEINRNIIEEEKQKQVDKRDIAFKWRLHNMDTYLQSINIPYPSQTEPYDLLEHIKSVSKLISNNEWILFAGTPGSGKTYLASMIARKISSIEYFKNNTIIYRSMTHLIGSIKDTWDQDGFNTGERLIKECVRADILMLEVNDRSSTKKTTDYRNEILFKIIDERYVLKQQRQFSPTLLIMVTGKGKTLQQAMIDSGIDKATIGRIVELGAANVYKFNDKDFRQTKAMEIKHVTTVN